MSASPAAGRRRRGGFGLLLLGVCVGLLLRGLLPGGGSGEPSSPAAEGEAGAPDPGELEARVEVARARRGSLLLATAALGRVEADPHGVLGLASRAGGRVLEVLVETGQEVRAGDVLLRFDRRPLEATLTEARAGLAAADAELDDFERGGRAREESGLAVAAEAARAAHELAQRRVEALEPLHAEGVVPDRSLLEARGEAARLAGEQQLAESDLSSWREVRGALRASSLHAARDAAAATLAEAQSVLDECELKAPRDGRVLSLSVSAGDAVDAGAALGTLRVASSTRVAFRVATDDLDGLVPGGEASFDDGRGGTVHGTILALPAEVDAGTGLGRLFVLPDEGASVPLPGSVVRGELVRGRLDGVLLVPDGAVVRALDRPTVIVVDDDDLAHAVHVSVLGRHASEVAVEGALEAGQRVVVTGGYNLPDGARVLPVDPSDAPSEGGR